MYLLYSTVSDVSTYIYDADLCFSLMQTQHYCSTQTVSFTCRIEKPDFSQNNVSPQWLHLCRVFVYVRCFLPSVPTL